MSPWMSLAPTVIAWWMIYVLALAIYRMTIHPLARFPGPKLAGASYLYEFWFDVILGGRYTWEIKRLHDRYGPIVRISPDELHCNDPNFVDGIYAGGNRSREKPEHFCGAFFPKFRMSGLCTKDHHHHRLRRRAVNKFFSRQSISKWEGLVHENAQKLCNKLLGHRGLEPFQALDAYSCFTTDVITTYCFGTGTGFLDQPNWTPNYRRALELLEGWNNTFRHFPWLCSAIGRIPPSVAKLASNGMRNLVTLQEVTIPNHIEALKSRSKGSNEPSTILSELLQSDLPPSEKTTERLTIEANVITFGGTETVAISLSSLTWHILSNPVVFRKLHDELTSLVTDTRHLPSWSTLEKCKYLTCVIMEGLRLGSGSAARQARVAPNEDLIYRGKDPNEETASSIVSYVIPRRYAIGMSPYLMHTNEAIFPNALEFNPERWLDSNGDRRTDLDHHFMSFSRGSRVCLGMQLAYCELYIGVAAIVLRAMPFMEVYETTNADMDYDHDEGIGKPKKGSKGLRIRMVDSRE